MIGGLLVDTKATHLKLLNTGGNMSLMLHCGASEVGLHELKDIPITPRVYHYIGKEGQP